MTGTRAGISPRKRLHGGSLARLALVAATSCAPLQAAPLFESAFQLYAFGSSPASVSAADVDHDGRADLVGLNAAQQTVGVLRGRGDGTFEDPLYSWAGASARRVELADVDADGHLDAVVVNQDVGHVSVLRGRGDGRFDAPSSFAAGLVPIELRIADLNGDGHLDLAIVNAATNLHRGSLSVLFGHGNGSFEPRVEVDPGADAPLALRIGDLDLDGHADLVLAHTAPNGVTVLYGDGDGGFASGDTWPLVGVPGGLGIGRLDGDARPDVAVFHENWDLGYRDQHISILIGSADSVLASRPDVMSESFASQVEVADVNGDGAQDLVALGARVGVALGHDDGTFEFPRGYDAGARPRDLVVHDLDQDGDADLGVCALDSQGIAVLLGHGDGSYGSPTLYTSLDPQWLLAGDLDADGDVDLVTPSAFYGVLTLHRGLGQGRFAGRVDVPVAKRPTGLVCADFDADGALDLATATFDSSRSVVSVLPGRPGGSYGPHADVALGAPATSIATGDWNGDGHPDLAATLWSSNWPNDDHVAILLGDGAGGFAAPVRVPIGPQPMALASADLNGDGNPDLVAAYRRRTQDLNGGVSVLLGDGHGGFGSRLDLPVGIEPRGLALGDLNGDGTVDIAAANSYYFQPRIGSVSVLLGHGDGTFQALPEQLAALQPWRLAILDADGDGHADLAVANAASYTVSLFFGAGDGSFDRRLDLGVGAGPLAVVAADLDADQRPDLAAVSRFTSSVTLLFNRILRTPIAVADLQAEATDAGVRLAWRLDAETQASLASVLVERALEPDGPWTTVSPAPLAPAVVMSFDDVPPEAARTWWYRLALVPVDGAATRTPPVAATPGGFAPRTALLAPSRVADRRFEVRYRIGPHAAPVRLDVYAVDGRRVRVLARGTHPPGDYRSTWEARDDGGRRLARGIYWLRLAAGDVQVSRRLLLLD
jgi:hypothetical protein